MKINKQRALLVILASGTAGPGLVGYFDSWPKLKAAIGCVCVLLAAIWVNKDEIWPKKAPKQDGQ